MHFGAEEVDLKNVSFTPELLGSLPSELARRYKVLPVFSSPGKLKLALADPSDIEAIDTMHRFAKCDVELCVADSGQLEEFIDRLYGADGKNFG